MGNCYFISYIINHNFGHILPRQQDMKTYKIRSREYGDHIIESKSLTSIKQIASRGGLISHAGSTFIYEKTERDFVMVSIKRLGVSPWRSAT